MKIRFSPGGIKQFEIELEDGSLTLTDGPILHGVPASLIVEAVLHSGEWATAKRECPHCMGEGAVIDPFAEPPTPTLFKCKTCEGTGRV